MGYYLYLLIISVPMVLVILVNHVQMWNGLHSVTGCYLSLYPHAGCHFFPSPSGNSNQHQIFFVLEIVLWISWNLLQHSLFVPGAIWLTKIQSEEKATSILLIYTVQLKANIGTNSFLQACCVLCPLPILWETVGIYGLLFSTQSFISVTQEKGKRPPGCILCFGFINTKN